MIRRTLLVLLILSLSVTILVVFPVSAKATVQPVVAFEYTCEAKEPEKSFTSGNILHIRNQELVKRKVSSDDPLLNGWDFIFLNMELNTTTGNGTAHGTSIFVPDSMDDIFEGTWTGKITNFVFSGHGISHGTGEFKGLIGIVKTIEQVPVPADPPCPTTEVQRLVGYMLDTRRE